MKLKYRIKGRKASERELANAMKRFETLTERQQAIVFQNLLGGEIDYLWTRLVYGSSYFVPHHRYPLSHGPQASDALRVLVNGFMNAVAESNRFKKSDGDIERDQQFIKVLDANREKKS